MTARPLGPRDFYPTVFDPGKAGQLVLTTQGPARAADAAALIADTLNPSGSIDLSRYDDATFTAPVLKAAAFTDPAERGEAFAELNTRAMSQAVVAPLYVATVTRGVGQRAGSRDLEPVRGARLQPAVDQPRDG